MGVLAALESHLEGKDLMVLLHLGSNPRHLLRNLCRKLPGAKLP